MFLLKSGSFTCLLGELRNIYNCSWQLYQRIYFFRLQLLRLLRYISVKEYFDVKFTPANVETDVHRHFDLQALCYYIVSPFIARFIDIYMKISLQINIKNKIFILRLSRSLKTYFVYI